MAQKLSCRVGESGVSCMGERVVIVEYFTCKNITVRFEDGTVAKHKTYSSFKAGTLKNPNYYRNFHIGEESISTKGQRMKIVEYISRENITVEFEDGTRVENREYKRFLTGEISNPNYKAHYVGEVSVNKSTGQKLTLIKYRSSSDVDVKFEDGTVIKHKTYDRFKQGNIRNPNFTSARYTGQTNIHQVTGMKMTIVAFRTLTDIDVMFEDGVIVKHKSVHNFKKGKITYPNRVKNLRLGETSVALNGLIMKVVDYKTTKDVEVEFEDGVRVKTYYDSFVRHSVAHPDLHLMSNGHFSKTSTLYNFQIKKLAYRYDNISNYLCTCKTCGYSDILSTEEMKQHKCSI